MLSSLQNPLVKHLVKLRENRAYRSKCKKALVIGKKVLETISPYIDIFTLIVDENQSASPLFPAEKQIFANQSVLKKISGLNQFDGFLAEVAIPPFQNLKNTNRLLILDQIQDPGNLGNLIRSALAFGFDGIFLLEGTADPFNQKTIMASRGGSFILPLNQGPWENLIEQAHNKTLFRADLSGPHMSKIHFKPPLGLILGNEGHGFSKEAKNGSIPFSIPMKINVESLNVAAAGAIAMYTMRSL